VEKIVHGLTSEFWAGKKVFLTGHTGFKGSWLALWLFSLGAKVTGFALPDDEAEIGRQKAFCPGVDSIYGDIRDYGSLEKALLKTSPDVVFHLAAQSLVRQSYVAPCETYAVNVMGTAHLLEAVRSYGKVGAAVIITTDKCYEDKKWLWAYRENDALGGHDPYSSSKSCAELVSASYRNSFFSSPGACAVATARAGNVIGGGDWAADRLIPDMVRAFTAGKQIRLRCPDAVRPWQHVLEPLAGYMLLAESAYRDASFAGSWNFGPSDPRAYSVGWVTRSFAEAWGQDARWALDSGHHPHETSLLRLDCSKAMQTLGWRPILDIDTALKWTADWYRRHATGESPLKLCLEQIERYSQQYLKG
jgi:CDP-glucose 4,6-dehydratase